MNLQMNISAELLEQVERGNVLIFVGEGINDGALPSSSDLAQELAKRCAYPADELATLPRVAGYYELTRGRNLLIQFLRDRLDNPDLRPGVTHQLIAQLPTRVIISTCYDRLLERVLRDAAVPYAPIVGNSDVAYSNDSQVLLAWLWGVLDQPESLIITEDDRRRFLDGRANLSDIVRGEVARRTWLFLGFDAADDWFRGFYDSVSRSLDRQRRRAYLVAPALGSYSQAWWENRNTEIISAEVRPFLDTFVKQLAGRPRPRAAVAPQPTLTPEALQPLPVRPYKQLDYYESSDVAIFFGREQETLNLSSLVHAHRLVLLYGASGVGKTSLLLAGAVARLEHADPPYTAIYIRALEDPAQAIRRAMIRLLPDANLPADGALVQALEAATTALGHALVIVLDQFEEFFIRLSPQFRNAFIAELGLIYDARDVPVKIVLSLREDWLAAISEIERRIPEVFQIKLRLLPLTRDQARLAITVPVERVGIGYEPALVDRLLDDLIGGQEPTVMPPQLQIVCSALYGGLRSGESQITLAGYERIGGAQGVLRQYLHDELDRLRGEERALARAALAELVTSQGTKAVKTADELALALEVGVVDLAPVLEKLVRARLLRLLDREQGGVVYELTHEYLIREIDVSTETQARKQVEELIKQEVENRQRFNTLMAADKLALVTALRDSLRLNDQAEELLIRSVIQVGDELDYWLRRASSPESLITLLADIVHSPVPAVRRRAVEAIGRVVAANSDVVGAAIQPTFDALLSDGESDVRSSLAVALGVVAAAQCERAAWAIACLGKLLIEEQNDVRSNSMLALRQIVAAHPEQAVSLVDTTLFQSLRGQDGSVRSIIVDALGQAGATTSAMFTPALIARLNSHIQDERSVAAEALGQIALAAPQMVVRALADWFVGQVREERIAVVGRIAATHPQVIVDALITWLADPRAEIRVAAVEALGQLGRTRPEIVTPEVSRALSLLQADEDRAVRDATAAAQSQLGEIQSRIVPREDLLAAVEAQLLSPYQGDFIGRDFVREDIRQFQAGRNRMLVLVGPPGVGKTALAAQLVREQLGQEYPYLAYFCGLSGDDNPYRFCTSLAEQLASQLGEGYALPQTVRSQQVTIQANANIGQAGGGTSIKVLTLNVGGMHPREAFRQLVREPLRAYDVRQGGERAGRPLTIVIDGLDHAWDWDGGRDANIVSLLADAQDLPPWVNLICTARPGLAVQALRAQAGVRVSDLHDDQNRQDIETFFRGRFLATLSDDERARFHLLLDAAGLDGSSDGKSVDGFVRQAVDASQGSFLLVRRYVDAWRAALRRSADQPALDPAILLDFSAGTLAVMLGAATLAELRQHIDASLVSADEDVLAALAIAFAPLNLNLLAHITGRPIDPIQQALEQRLKPVLEQHGDGDALTYSLYDRGFGDYVRRQLIWQGRGWDVQAAHALGQDVDDDPLLRDYSTRFRWSHLLRGLDLAAVARDSIGVQGPTVVRQLGAQRKPATFDPFDSIGQLQAQVSDPVTQAQLLRTLAARALDPAQADAIGGWTAALNCLKAAEQTLRRSGALAYTRQRGWRAEAGGPISDELIGLERTLFALGDAYSTIARRMDTGGEPPDWPPGILGTLYKVWDSMARLPLTLYFLLVLLLQGVTEISIIGALQNLGRGQDWTIARLYVLAVSAYRRARSLARARGADDSADEVAERLAGLYMRMGAYDAAALGYETLLARPSAITRAWRQAVWRLELGEVLVAQRRPDQAIEVLTAALPTFVSQQAPVQQARALSALGAAYHLRANAAHMRRNTAEAYGDLHAALDDQTIESCRAALAAWQNVTTLQGDESASVDPALAISNIAHQLWCAARSSRMSDEQRNNARALLATIPARHYLQRFEHPVLRLFRITAAVLLPAYLLAGLLLAVQIPSIVEAHTRTELSLPAPLVDLTRFPNDLIAGRATSLTAAEASAFSVASLTKLAGSLVALQLDPPRLSPLGTSRVPLMIMLIYLLIYTLFGLAVTGFSSPAQFQGHQPGRIILSRESLVWRGSPAQGSLLDAFAWFRQDAQSIWARLPWRVAGMGRRVAPAGPRALVQDTSLQLTDIAGVIAVDRRAFGYLLSNFSITLVHPRDPARRTIIIPGSIAHYAELGDELARRLNHPPRDFGVDIIRSWWGVCFLLTLFYMLTLLVLLPLNPTFLNTPLPGLGYSLTNLYVLAAPGLLIPLLWWFVAQPLGANLVARSGTLPLVATALAGAALTAGVLADQISLASLGLRPDLATPVLAIGFLGAVFFYAPARPLRRIFSLNIGYLARTLLALVSLGGMVLLAWHLATTLRWYDAEVRGNRLVVQALAPAGCVGDAHNCVPLAEAIDNYTSMICLRPSDSDGYAFRGFAQLARRQYDQASADFERALGVRVPSDACALGNRTAPTTSQRTSLYANIGAVDTLLARQLPPARAEAHYQNALHSYARALALPDDDNAPGCAPMARNLLQPEGALDLVSELNSLTSRADSIDPYQTRVVLQLADTCYIRGSAGVTLLESSRQQPRGTDRDAIRQSTWQDLAAAIAEYRAVIDSTPDSEERALAQRGLATAWLAISQIDRPPAGAPDAQTALFNALFIYQELSRTDRADSNIFGGLAWSAIQLGAWGNAKAPLAAASALAPDNPTYPALQGLAAWLDSTQYPAPKKGELSPEYTAAISDALGFYSRVIAIGTVDLPRAHATRSLLAFSLRNSPRGDTYTDGDYEFWMRLAIADADQTLFAAVRDGLPPERQVGYRYWRGRLSFSLALTWQEKSRGQHAWAELTPLYSSAYADFSSAAAIDLNPERRKIFRDTWLPWTSALLNNATNMQLAQAAVRQRDFAQAGNTIALVDPRPSSFQKWDMLSAPLPDYHFLHGLISLGLGMPKDFPNPLLKRDASADQHSDAAADYAEAIAVTENSAIVPQQQPDYPDDSRPAIYRAALEDLENLLANPPPGWSPAARSVAEQVRRQLQERLKAIKL